MPSSCFKGNKCVYPVLRKQAELFSGQQNLFASLASSPARSAYYHYFCSTSSTYTELQLALAAFVEFFTWWQQSAVKTTS